MTCGLWHCMALRFGLNLRILEKMYILTNYHINLTIKSECINVLLNIVSLPTMAKPPPSGCARSNKLHHEQPLTQRNESRCRDQTRLSQYQNYCHVESCAFSTTSPHLPSVPLITFLNSAQWTPLKAVHTERVDCFQPSLTVANPAY